MKNTITLLFVLISTLTLAQLPQNGLLFHFPFNGNMTDACPNAVSANLMTINSGSVTLDADKTNNPNMSSYFGGGYLDLGINDKLTLGDNSFSFVGWVCETNYQNVASIFTNNFGFVGGISIGLRNGAFFAAVGGGTMSLWCWIVRPKSYASMWTALNDLLSTTPAMDPMVAP